MKKFLQLALFFSLAITGRLSAQIMCSASIVADTSNPSGGMLLTALPTGTAPFTYLWTTGETTPSVNYTQWGANICVFISDAAGCTATTCLFNSAPCLVNITASNTGEYTAVPVGGTAPYTYAWSSGETTPTIQPSAPGSYCVTITDMLGCTASECFTHPGSASCGVSVYLDSSNVGTLILVAFAQGQAPFTYLWNNGSTSASVPVNSAGNYCVTVTDASGCTASDCYNFGNSNICSVDISVEQNPQGYLLSANATGTAPFSYQWNVQNWTTQSIQVPPLASGIALNYCVSIADASGCVSSNCITLVGGGGGPADSCTVFIVEYDTIGTTGLYAIASTANVQYQWSTGETTQAIFPATSGTYCVTVTNSAGCTATDCYQYTAFNANPVQGLVLLPDSLNTAVVEGMAELWQEDPASGEMVIFAAVPLASHPTVLAALYQFGAVPNGNYLIRIMPDTGSVFFDEYLPTYYGDVTEWEEATLVTLPANQPYFNITLSDGQNLTGPGSISGLVSDGEGFTGSGDDRGNPQAGISILLFDAAGLAISHELTGSDGKYAFDNLPYGTYEVVVDLVGKPRASRWVTIGAENPVSSGNDFEIGEEGIVSQVDGEMTESATAVLQVFPNPGKGELQLRYDATQAFDTAIQLLSATGQLLSSIPVRITAGGWSHVLQIGHVPAGLYILQFQTEAGLVSSRVVISE